MSQTHKNTINSFFNKQEEKVTATMVEVAKKAFDILFENSPHINAPSSNYSLSQYDANHQLSINQKQLRPVLPPTMNKEISKEVINEKKQSLNSIVPGESVIIHNDVDHGLDVEKGGPTWSRNGYFTYEKTTAYLRIAYSNVIK